MISAADFKKQISKTLAGDLKTLGFQRSCFNYLLDTDNFIFTIGIQASQYGGQCCAEFGVQPKEIERFGDHKIDFKKLKYYSCEFRTRLSRKNSADQWWKYSKNEQTNIEIPRKRALRQNPKSAIFISGNVFQTHSRRDAHFVW